jgi:hypothetical protein
MKFPYWLRILRGKRRPARRDARPGRSRLSLEPLEDRLALSASPLAPLSYEQWRLEQVALDQGASLVASTDLQILANDIQPNAMQGTSLIGLDRVFSDYPYRGNGYSVAVIDTGIDYRHPALGGGWGSRVIAGYDFVNNDSDPIDDNGHGTHVAGIIGSSDANYTGIAPGVNLVALKVLGADGSGSFGDVEDALRWVINNRSQYNIVAVNLSLGVGNYTSNPYTFLEEEFTTLKSQGVFIAAASGNSFYSYNSQTGLGYPAISPNAVAVGAVWTGNFGPVHWTSGARDYTTAADRVTSFSQRSAGLDLFAPGAMLTSTYLGGGFQTMAGTSMASPVVAGAAALLHQALDARALSSSANQDSILGIMQSTGRWIYDGDDEDDNVANIGQWFRRLDLHAAMHSILGDANQPPTLSPIADQTMAAGQNLLTVTVSASDPDGNTLSYSVRAYDYTWIAYQLDQQLGFSFPGSYNQNAHGANEKWLNSTLSGDWYCILPNGELRKWSGSWPATMAQGGLISTLNASYHADPSKLWNAPPAVTPAVGLSFAGAQLTVDPAPSVVGTFFVEVTVSDGQATATRTFRVTVSNGEPVLSPIADQTMRAGQDRITVSLSAWDPDGDPLTFSGRALEVGRDAYDLDQYLGLNFPGSYYENGHGLGEKWMTGASGDWYCILPSGQVRRWSSSLSATLSDQALVGTLNADYHADPSKLWNAPLPALPPVTLSFSGNQPTVDPAAGFLGTFTVEVTASDGKSSVARSFRVTVTNAAPVLASVLNQTMPSSQDVLTVNLSATDADGDALSYSGLITSVTSLAYQLDYWFGLTYAGDYYQNAHGHNEKWLTSASGDWYCILPSGEFRKWTGSDATTFATSGVVTTLTSGYYADPSRLWDAQPGSTAQVSVSAQGNQLRLDPVAGFVGSFVVQATVSDGTATVNQTFTVTVTGAGTNSSPTLTSIADQSLSAGQDVLNLALSASDPDGDPLTFSARVTAGDTGLAHNLDQGLGLSYAGGYFVNNWGQNEKWVLGGSGEWYCLFPTGQLRRWAGSLSATLSDAGLIAVLDASYYADPSSLWNATPSSGAISLSLSGNQLTINPAQGFVGNFTVEVTVSDGGHTASRSFSVTVA